MSSASNGAYDLMFFAWGWGFALVAIVMSWAWADHGLREVALALRSRDEKRREVLDLVQKAPQLDAEYLRVYSDTRKRALVVIEQGKALFQLYLQRVRKNAKYPDIQMNFSEIPFPPELAALEPPPLRLADSYASGVKKEE